MLITPIILAGGSGTRLWPLSRKCYPKQFHKLNSDLTLFQETTLRVKDGFAKPIIVCNEDHRFLVEEQLKEINIEAGKIILEPEGRNTAPAISISILINGPDNYRNKFLVLSADHFISDSGAFNENISHASNYLKDNIITFGIIPTFPSTDYGYIETFKESKRIYRIKKFTEKPSIADAEKFLDDKNYFWNSGIFLFKGSTFINELKLHSPKIYESCLNSSQKITSDHNFIRVNSHDFLSSPSISIDYAIMEKTSKGLLLPLTTKWSDLGTWNSLWANSKKDSYNNYKLGPVTLIDSKNCYIRSKHRNTSVLGLEDIIVIDTKDALVISKKDSTDHIKDLVNSLENSNSELITNHARVLRPWGFYNSLQKASFYQIKHIVIYPKKRISLQKHQYRSEHWIIIKGVATVTIDGNQFKLSANESTFVPIGSIHRLENETLKDLEIIEIQTGSYLNEDDIIRLDDDYQRV